MGNVLSVLFVASILPLAQAAEADDEGALTEHLMTEAKYPATCTYPHGPLSVTLSCYIPVKMADGRPLRTTSAERPKRLEEMHLGCSEWHSNSPDMTPPDGYDGFVPMKTENTKKNQDYLERCNVLLENQETVMNHMKDQICVFNEAHCRTESVYNPDINGQIPPFGG